MLQHMSAKVFNEWLQVFINDPWDERRADVRGAIVASASIAPHLKTGASPPPLSAFMPKYGEDESRSDVPQGQTMSTKDMRAVFGAAGKAWKRAARQRKERKKCKANARKRR